MASRICTPMLPLFRAFTRLQTVQAAHQYVSWKYAQAEREWELDKHCLKAHPNVVFIALQMTLACCVVLQVPGLRICADPQSREAVCLFQFISTCTFRRHGCLHKWCLNQYC